MATTRHINFADAVDPQDATPLHQVQAIATAAAVPATAGAVATTGHTAESALVSIAGTVSDLPLTANTVLGRGPTGDIVAVPFSTVVSGGGGSGITALTGDVAATGPGSAAATIQPLAVDTGKIAAAAVTNAKRANMAASTLSGNATGSPAAPTDLTAAAVKTLLAISFSDISSTLLAAQFPALTGDVTTPGGSLATTLANLPQAVLLTRTGALTASMDIHGQQIVNAADPTTPQALATRAFVLAQFSGGVPLVDGNKGDITVSGSGATWLINALAVTFAKMQNIATQTLIGRQTAGSGSPESIGVTGGVEFDGSGNIRVGAFTGDVIKSAGSAGQAIAAAAVTNAKLANMAASTLKGNATGSPAAPTDLTAAAVKTLLAISLTADVTGVLQAGQFPALTGDVTTTAGSLVTALKNIPTGVTMAGRVRATAIAAPATPPAGTAEFYVDSTGKVLAVKNDAGAVSHTVRTNAGGTSQFLTSIADDGTVGSAQVHFTDVGGLLGGPQIPGLSGDVDNFGGGNILGFSPVPANTIIANPLAFTSRPAAQNLATIRTMLGQSDPPYMDLFFSWGIGDGNNSDSTLQSSIGPGLWPFWLLPNTKASDIVGQPYAGTAVDANLATPAMVNDWEVSAHFTQARLEVFVRTWLPVSAGSLVFRLSINTLVDSSPIVLSAGSTGRFDSGIVALGGATYADGDTVGVRCLPTGMVLGANKAKFTAHLRLLA